MVLIIGLGCSLATVSCFMLSMYMNLTKQAKSEIPSDTLLLSQLFVTFIPCTILSVGMESWTPWLEMTSTGWMVAIAFVSVGYISNVSQIYSIRILGSSTVSSILPSRLVVSSLLGAFALGEILSPLQYFGIVLIMAAVTFYLVYGRRAKKDRDAARRFVSITPTIPEVDEKETELVPGCTPDPANRTETSVDATQIKMQKNV